MKIICIAATCLLLNSLLSYSQVDVSLGIVGYNPGNDNIGLSAGVTLKNLSLDISSNLKGGAKELGKYLGYNGKTGDNFIFLINTGYNFPVKKKLYIMPQIGIGWISDIYLQQTGSRRTFTYEDFHTFINIGLCVKFFIKNDLGFIIGGGYPELGKISLVYKLWD